MYLICLDVSYQCQQSFRHIMMMSGCNVGNWHPFIGLPHQSTVPLSHYGKCPKISYTKVSDKMAYAFARNSLPLGTRILWNNCLKNKIWAKKYGIITKTYLCNFDPLKPHFYIVKVGFTGVYIIISAQNIDCGYSLELPRRGSSNEYPQSMFWAEI